MDVINKHFLNAWPPASLHMENETSDCRFVVTPLTAEDVVAAVQFAADFCLKVAALGTGHQIAGLALAEAGVTIQMRNLNATSFDNTTFVATAQVQACSLCC